MGGQPLVVGKIDKPKTLKGEDITG